MLSGKRPPAHTPKQATSNVSLRWLCTVNIHSIISVMCRVWPPHLAIHRAPGLLSPCRRFLVHGLHLPRPDIVRHEPFRIHILLPLILQSVEFVHQRLRVIFPQLTPLSYFFKALLLPALPTPPELALALDCAAIPLLSLS